MAKTPLGDRGVAVRAKLRPTDANEANVFDHAMASEWYQEGLRLRAKKDDDGAIHAYRQALRLTPDDDGVQVALSWLLATCPSDKHRDGKQAVELVTRVCERSAWKNPAHIGTLAAAYAEVGDFAKAIELQTKTLEFPESDPYMRSRRRDRLELFRKKQAFRDVPQPVAVPPELQVGTYAAKFPGETTRKFNAVPVGARNVTVIRDTVEVNGVAYVIASNEYAAGSLDTNPQKVLEGVRNGNIGQGQLLTEQHGEFGMEKYPMREFTFLKDKLYFRNRIILVENRLYQVMIVATAEKDLATESANTLYDSFTLEPAAVTAFNKQLIEREARRQARRDDILAGRVVEPKAAAEAIDLAKFAKGRARFAASVRLYEKAFELEPKLAEDMTASHRYDGACYAARAARGDGVGAPADPEARAALRGKALAWLQADLAIWKKQAATDKPEERERVAAKMNRWLKDTDLTETRSGAKRDGWGEAEGKAWDALWTEVQATRDIALKTREVKRP